MFGPHLCLVLEMIQILLYVTGIDWWAMVRAAFWLILRLALQAMRHAFRNTPWMAIGHTLGYIILVCCFCAPCMLQVLRQVLLGGELINL